MKRKRRFFDGNMNFVRVTGRFAQKADKLIVDIELSAFHPMMLMFVGAGLLIYAFAITTIFMNESAATDDMVWARLFLLVHGLLMFGIPYVVLRRRVRLTRYEIERDLFFIRKTSRGLWCRRDLEHEQTKSNPMNKLIDIYRNKSFRIAVVLTLVYFGIGFIFLYFDLSDYGWIFFVLLPISLGIAIGAMPVEKWTYLGLAVGMVFFIVLLLVGAVEGMVCVLMAVPIIVPLVMTGILINKILKAKGIIKPTKNVNIMVWPLVITLIGAPIEKHVNADSTEIGEVRSERILPYTAEQVYDAIKSVDTLVADKSFLMKLDLPVPNKCILEKEEIGGLRTCYFSGGTITERITAIERGKVLRMDVIDCNLTGLKWLGFKEAIYYFEDVGKDSCKITRVTTYSSALKPRIYWERLEKVGIEQEHDYVLDNLSSDLVRKHGK